MAKKQKSGLYRTKVKIGVDPSGKDLFKYVSGTTKAELEKNKQAVIDYYINGTGLETDMLFGAYAHEWFTVRKKPFISPASIESYRTALNKDILPVFEDRHLRSIRPMDLQTFINGYAGRSATKITVIMATLRGIFENACADRILAQNPMEHIRKPKASAKKEREMLKVEDREKVEAVCMTHPKGGYLAALYYLGCRPGEGRGLQWGDFNEDMSLVHIQRDIDYKDGCKAGSLKTAKSDRWLPVPEPLQAILKPLRGPSEAFCFTGDRNTNSPIAKASGERLWVEYMVQAGLVTEVSPDEAKRYAVNDIRRKWKPLVTPYCLRHNYITMCWENGFDPYETMKLAGHTSITVTLNIYTHLSAAQMAKTQTKVNKMFKANRPQ